MIYLDYNATTPIDPEVAQAMLPFLNEHFGNPGSRHVQGVLAKEAIDTARSHLSGLLNAGNGQVLFTGCATEANNWVIKGVAQALAEKGRHLISTTVEHPSVLGPLAYLSSRGWEVTYLSVDNTGLPDPDALKAALRDDTVLVSAMLANNETGTILPIRTLATIAHEHGARFHTDASQAVGKIEVDAEQLGVDYLTVAGHKFCAPKGIGALFIRDKSPIAPLIHGGGQERGLRSGTENLLHIVGLGQAASLAGRQTAQDAKRIVALRDLLYERMAQHVELKLIGHPAMRLPNTLNVAFVGCKGERVLDGADPVAASLGAACHDRDVTMSPVLAAMGVDPMVARGAVRLSLGRPTTKDEVLSAACLLVDSAQRELHRRPLDG